MFRNSSFHFPRFAWVGGTFDNPEQDSFLFRHEKHHDRHHGRGEHRGRHGHREPFGKSWGDESRTRRGDIKFILLEMLSDRSSHGYDLIKEMESRYGGFRRLSPGSVYPTLQMLEEGGYLTSESIGGKRVYTITDAGRELLAERFSESISDSSREICDVPQEFNELRNAVTELSAVVMQVARNGNTVRMNRVRELLEQTKRDIYAMLAEKSI
ncbi:MAG: PadR family transcriptional regulator [Scytonematopsis contorta HA4267-MV1]|jgi:DNA-binding PadR family transcriptional regulator|nr:PadR family transcriptional regulator [Scytonematopsis contorta HA4267-MV1]